MVCTKCKKTITTNQFGVYECSKCYMFWSVEGIRLWKLGASYYKHKPKIK